MLFNVLFCIKKIFFNDRYEGKGREPVWYRVFYHCMAYVVMVVAVSSLAYAGKNPLIYQTDDKKQWPVFWVMLLQGLVQQHMSLHLMLYEATRMSYNPIDNRLLVFVLINCGLIWIFGENLKMDRVVIGLNVIVIFCSLHYIINLI